MRQYFGPTAASVTALLLASLLPPAAALAADYSVPITVEITELWQLSDVETPPNLADAYPVVSINGVEADNDDFICDNPGTAGYIIPFHFFSEDGGADPSCRNLPWTFTVNVPLAALVAGVPLQIQILDEDAVFDDHLTTVNLVVHQDGTWTGDVTSPNNCNKEVVLDGGARVCWRFSGFDRDGDGLLDDWEENGLDIDGNGTIDGNDLDLPALGADPDHKDLFVELDWRAGSPPRANGIQKWKEAFALAPIDAGGVPNPDGLPGINLHVDTGSLVDVGGVLVGDNLGGGNQLAAQFPACDFGDDFKAAKAANFDEARRSSVFRYGIQSTFCCQAGSPNAGMVCSIDAQCGAGGVCTPDGGLGELGGDDFIAWNDPFSGKTLMHELGHNLNLDHGGASRADVGDNCKPNYISIMNYQYPVIESISDGTTVIPGILDFSPARLADGTRGQAPLPPLAEDALDETAILDPSDPQHLLSFMDPAGTRTRSAVSAPVDWDGVGGATDNSAEVNIDYDPSRKDCTDDNAPIRTAADPLTGHDDWRNMSLPFTHFGASADDQVVAPDFDEPTDQEIQILLEEQNTADLAIAKAGPAGPFEATQDVDLTYGVGVVNAGPNPALVPRVQDTLPPGSTLLSADPSCAENPAGTLTCNLATLLKGQEKSLSLSVRTQGRCVNGLPVPIDNTATVENASEFAGADPNPGDNSSAFSSTVVDTTAPTITLAASPSRLWPPNHKFKRITITVTTNDACDPTPAVKLLSIVSNQPANSTGDGNTAVDIKDAAFGTDDRSFSLRAERKANAGTRTYTITYEVKDKSGNAGTKTVAVRVPKNNQN